MNEQVLIKTIQNLSQDIAKLTVDKNIHISELTLVKEENARLQERIAELEKEQA